MTLRAPLIAAFVLLTSCASAGAAERKWYPPQAISGKGMVNAQAIMDREGGAFVLFAPVRPPFDLVHATARPAGGEFSDPFVVDWLRTRAVGFAVTATFDSAGRATLIWPEDNPDGTRKALWYSTHHPETKQWITREFNPSAAIPVAAQPDGKGTVMAAWVQPAEDGNCCVGPFVARRRHGSPFTEPQRVAERAGDFLTLATSRTGAAVIAWADFANGFRTVVQPPDGQFGSVEPIPGAAVGLNGMQPQVSIDDRGEALFALKSSESTGSMQEPDTRVVVVIRRSDGTWEEPQTLSTANQTSAPRIAAGPAGEAVVAWTQGGRENATLRASVRGPDGEFSAPVTIDAGGLWRLEPEIGMDDAANAIVAWSAKRDGMWRVYASHRPPHGNFGPRQAISEEFPSYDEFFFPIERLAVGGPGNAIVTWHRPAEEFTDTRIDAAVFDVDRPSVPEFEVEPERLTFSWTVSEQSRTTITLKRGERKVRTVKSRAGAGENRKRIRRGSLPAGRYSAVLRATDGLGHRSKRRYARFRLAPR